MKHYDAPARVPGRLTAAALAIVLCAGCSAPAGSGGSSSGGQDSDSGRLARASSLESEGKHGEAFDLYGTIQPGTSEEGPGYAYALARFRMGRCMEENGRTVDARAFYAEVLAMPSIMASDGDIPEPGSIDIHLRKQAEVSMARLGFGVQEFYLIHARDERSAVRLAAVKSLERVGDEKALPALESCIEGKDEALKAAAARSADRIRARAARNDAGGGR
jgi:HEAT repeat protein